MKETPMARRSPRIIRAALPLALALAAAVAARAAGQPLRILSASPIGVLHADQAARIQILFSAAVVPLAAAEPMSAPPDWLSIDPPIQARWRWAGTAELIGEPLKPLPRATTYRFRISKVLKGIDGGALGDDYLFQFTTLLPEVVIAEDLYTDPMHLLHYRMHRESLDPSTSIVLVWNQPVDAESLSRHLKVRLVPAPFARAGSVLAADEVERLKNEDRAAFKAWESFLARCQGPPEGEGAFRLEPDKQHPTQIVHLTPRKPWPRSARVEVTVVAGVRGVEGTEAAPEGQAVFTIPPPPAPLGFFGRSPRTGKGGFDPDDLRLRFTSPVRWSDLAPFLTYRAVDEKEEVRHKVRPNTEAWWWQRAAEELSFDPLHLEPGREYQICLAADAPDASEEKLGFPWCGRLSTAHRQPAFYLVEGDGVVEWDGPHAIPLKSFNVTDYHVTHRRLSEEELARAILRRDETHVEPALARAPAVTIEGRVDRPVLSPVALDGVLAGAPGIVETRLAVGAVEPDSEYDADEAETLRRPRATITQVTSLGLTVKTSQHEGILVWVTRLKDTRPVAHAVVTVRDQQGHGLWQGTTDAAGLARSPRELPVKKAFVVFARLGDDLAYARAEWDEGQRGYDFNLAVDWHDAVPVVGSVWADRGVVRPGESVHLKAVLRRREDRSLGIPEVRAASLVVRDSRGQDALVQEVRLDGAGAAEVEMPIPQAAPLGSWEVILGDRYDKETRHFAKESVWDAEGSFRVAEFRRPKFRVAVTAAQESLMTGDAFAATIEGSFLAGGAMSGAPATWTARASRSWWSAPGSRWDGWEFLPTGIEDQWEDLARPLTVGSGEGTLDPRGQAPIAIARLEARHGWPTRLDLEAEVRDVDRQASAGSTTVTVLPGTFFVGLRRPAYFVEAAKGVDTQLIALSPKGEVVGDVKVRLSLVRRHWESVRRREVSGRYVFESRQVTQEIADHKIDTGNDPVAAHFDLSEGGEYVLIAKATDPRGNEIQSATAFYVFGPGFSPWRLDQGNRIDLVPERDTWAAGETARVLVKSPWEHTTALVSVERAGVLEARVVELTGTMPMVEVPVRPEH
ncbi:MAG TPA: MG2 domain-containing protein, partial [Candidatus Polarisedimenticolia bacterium]|nr:MG2 domain-containing protein [Candidatus Polarisedimenticolia bacterium]